MNFIADSMLFHTEQTVMLQTNREQCGGSRCELALTEQYANTNNCTCKKK